MRPRCTCSSGTYAQMHKMHMQLWHFGHFGHFGHLWHFGHLCNCANAAVAVAELHVHLSRAAAAEDSSLRLADRRSNFTANNANHSPVNRKKSTETKTARRPKITCFKKFASKERCMCQSICKKSKKTKFSQTQGNKCSIVRKQVPFSWKKRDVQHENYRIHSRRGTYSTRTFRCPYSRWQG